MVGGGRVNRVRLLKVKAVDIHPGVPKPYVESRMLSLGLSVKLKHFSDTEAPDIGFHAANIQILFQTLVT